MSIDVLRNYFHEETIRNELQNQLLEQLSKYDDFLEGLNALGTYPSVEVTDNGTRNIIFHQCPFPEVAGQDHVLCDVDKVVLESQEDTRVDVQTTIARGGKQYFLHLDT